MQNLKISITENDIQSAEGFKIANPVLFMLQRATGTFWRIYDDGFALEIMAPFRSCLLPDAALRCWREYSSAGRMAPVEFEVELHSPEVRASQLLNRHQSSRSMYTRRAEAFQSRDGAQDTMRPTMPSTELIIELGTEPIDAHSASRKTA